MNAPEFVALSTTLVSNLKKWVAEASRDTALGETELALLQETLKVIEKVTFTEADIKPDTDN